MFQALERLCLQPGQDTHMELGINIIMVAVEMVTTQIINGTIYWAGYMYKGPHRVRHVFCSPYQPCEAGVILVTFILHMRKQSQKRLCNLPHRLLVSE